MVHTLKAGRQVDHPGFGALSIPYRRVRQPITLNLFKVALLGDSHIPGDAQTEAVRRALSKLSPDYCLDWRTWSSWFSESPPAAHKRSIQELDRLFAHVRQDGSSAGGAGRQRPSFLCELACGGLMYEMLQRTSSKHPDLVIRQRASKYRPGSAWHLHLDALECLALADGFEGIRNSELKACAARSILGALHGRWNPRTGLVYKYLQSDLAVLWNKSNDEERRVIGDFYRQRFPGCFEAHFAQPARPCWTEISVAPDISINHIYRLLFCLAATPDFLVQDRYQSWCLDLVTSGIAMYALAWTDPLNSLRDRKQPEVIFWEAFEALFFEAAPDCDALAAARRAMKMSHVKWSPQAGDLLLRAREDYKQALERLGVPLSHVNQMVQAAWRGAVKHATSS